MGAVQGAVGAVPQAKTRQLAAHALVGGGSLAARQHLALRDVLRQERKRQTRVSRRRGS